MPMTVTANYGASSSSSSASYDRINVVQAQQHFRTMLQSQLMHVVTVRKSRKTECTRMHRRIGGGGAHISYDARR